MADAVDYRYGKEGGMRFWSLMNGWAVVSDHRTMAGAYRALYRYIKDRAVLPAPKEVCQNRWLSRNEPHTVRVVERQTPEMQD
jgi:hypothetical protein